MIGRLKGKIEALASDHAIIDVNGVGYIVHCTSTALADLSVEQNDVALWIDTHVREDMIRLHGFLTIAERDLFRILQSVQGVGAKVAIGILSTLTVTDAAIAIVDGDDKAIARTPGVGPKLAGRIVAELKGKIPDALVVRDGARPPSALTSEAKEAEQALCRLGFETDRAKRAVAHANDELGVEATSRDLIRIALRHLAA